MKDNDKDIGQLIRSAGRRRQIPEAELAALETSAREAWNEMVAAERRRKRRQRMTLAIAATLLLAVLGAWWWGARLEPWRTPVERVATLERAVGLVKAGEVEIRTGEGLPSGTIIETGGLAALRMEAGQSVRLDMGTRVRLLSRTRLELAEGAIYVDSGAEVAANADLTIVTPLGLVTEVGTQYEVQLDDGSSLRVRVREGTVAVTRDGESHEARAGDQLVLGRDGGVERSAVATVGPEWDWTWIVAPSFDIEGRSLGEFLEWVARETGWQVRYADEELEQSSGEIVLHGTIEGLQPDESVRMILQGSGLDYRSDNGTVTILHPK